MRLIVFRYLSIFFLFSLLWNLPVLMDMKFSKEKTNAPVIDPSGYYNLANPPEKAESAEKVDDDKSSSTFVANFFGLPAILLVI